MNVDAINAFDDNYIWLLTEAGSRSCAVVDPGDEEPVIAELQRRGLELAAILITHKHFDHVGGIKGLKALWPEAVVFGPADEPIAGLDHRLSEAQQVKLPAMQLVFDVLDVPGHTEGHIAYYGHDSLFCGDTLFAGGCGRVFSGTFEQLSASLAKIRHLPAGTSVYCAHEYTQANLGFAKWVEPQSQLLQQRIAQVDEARSQGRATVPSLLQSELDTNPFLRVTQDNVIAAAQKHAGRQLLTEADVFTVLRQWKDRDYD